MQGIGAMQGARRLVLLLVLQLLAAVVVTAASAATTTTTTTKLSGALELPHANLTAAIDGWTADTAVMFYAPWCKYCKQLKPSWDQIAKLTTPQYRDLRVTIFNCEEPTANAELCATLGVDRYPSLYYFGYSSFNQAPRGNPFGASEFGGRVARFNADLYPEAIFEWVKMLSSVSSWQRKWADVTGIFTGRSHHTSRLEALARENAALQRKVSIFGTELEKHRADKLFDSVLDSGDPFPQLHLLTPAASNLALRTCIGEMVREYCKYHQEDKEDRQYCAIIDECSELDMEPLQCRPRTCPLNSRGCRVASACLQTDVIDAYNAATAKATTAASAGASAGGKGGSESAGATAGGAARQRVPA